jgi:hypothetical protein
MRMIPCVSLLTTALVFTSAAAAQDATKASQPVCHASACAFEFDWGSGQSAASIAVDRRYGSGADFEAGFRSRMAEKGFNLTTDLGTAGLRATIRTAMTSAMCEVVPGLNPDRRCRTMRDVDITFIPIDTTIKRLGKQRIVNRCGDRNQLMTMMQFGQYVADMVYYAIEGEGIKAQRPGAKC